MADNNISKNTISPAEGVQPTAPALRFHGFTEPWIISPLNHFAKKIINKNKDNRISNILSNSANLGIIPQKEYFDRDIANQDNTNGYYVIEHGDFVYNPRKSVTAPFGPVNIYEGYEVGIISPLYLCFKVSGIDSLYLRMFFKSNSWHRFIYENGDSGVRHDRVSIKDDVFLQLPVCYPKREEQLKIANLLSLIDERIAVQRRIIDKLETLILGLRKEIFGKYRKSLGFNTTIGDVLQYEQPQSYIVKDVEYVNNGIPVLTANKAFILGYTFETDGIYKKGNCIIFDDFTLDCKYVDFPFKVKSSAIKILTAQSDELLRYAYEYLKYLNLTTEEHKRHYIAETQNQGFILPNAQTVEMLSYTFSVLHLRLSSAVKLKNKYEEQRQYLLHKMFI